MVYGNFKNSTVNEKTKCDPVGIYGNFKFAAEFMIKSFKQTYDLDYTILRPSALYGERCISRRVGQVFLENAFTKKPLVINGSLNEKLDFTHIDDLISGIKLSIKNKNAKSQIFNITYGRGRKIEDLLKILKNNFPDIKIILKKRDKLVPVRGTLSIKKAKELLKYKPKLPLEIGYRKYIEWYKNFLLSNEKK
jgi:nucleoside-diphosphate-sugar epimerase